MNKEQIDEIALNVAVKVANTPWPEVPAYHSELTGEDKRFYSEFTHTLLAELAKQSEPVGYQQIFNAIAASTSVAAAPGINISVKAFTESIGPLFTHPLQPDLVAEIESLNSLIEYHVTNQKVVCEEIQKLRQQLSAAEKEMMMLRDALNLLYSWANNWDSEFMNDPDWKNRDLLIVQKALVITGD